MAYLFVFFLGGLLGASEVIACYSGFPIRGVLLNLATVVYCLVNSLISIFSYYLMDQLNLVSFPEHAQQAEFISKILVAGLGAAAVLRLGISFQVAGQTLTVSLMSIFDPILRAADASIRQATNRKNISDSKKILQDVSEEEAFNNLPIACFRLARLDEEEREVIQKEIEGLKQSPEIESIKVQSLGRILIPIVGADVLESLVTSIKNERKSGGGSDDVGQPGEEGT